MGFSIGDRVRANISDCPGLDIGECGTVVGFDAWGAAVVEWDELNPHRHDSDGLARDGHGWYTHDDMLEYAYKYYDLGQLPEIDTEDMKLLFDIEEA